MFSLKHNLIAITFVVIAICTLQVKSDNKDDIKDLLMKYCEFKNNINEDSEHIYEEKIAESLKENAKRAQIESLLNRLKQSVPPIDTLPPIDTSTYDKISITVNKIANDYQSKIRANKFRQDDPIGSYASCWY